MTANLKLIASLADLPYNESNFLQMELLQRIESLLPAGVTPNAENVAIAESEAAERGGSALLAIMAQIGKAQEPVERVYKIKRSLKGARIKIAGFEGRKFSFGPVWNDMVKAKKGAALRDRLKLEAQAAYLGVIVKPEMSIDALLNGVIAKL